MNPAGVVIAIAGTWIICQVFAGDALQRLNIVKPVTDDGGGGLIPGLPGSLPNPGDLVPGGKGNPGNWWDIPGAGGNPFKNLPFTSSTGGLGGAVGL